MEPTWSLRGVRVGQFQEFGRLPPSRTRPYIRRGDATDGLQGGHEGDVQDPAPPIDDDGRTTPHYYDSSTQSRVHTARHKHGVRFSSCFCSMARSIGPLLSTVVDGLQSH